MKFDLYYKIHVFHFYKEKNWAFFALNDFLLKKHFNINPHYIDFFFDNIKVKFGIHIIWHIKQMQNKLRISH